ncbi:hypothetical protein CHS0354_025627 [Potamilus streckersoni]|uniref:Uncharacterized protein n=1 Tax=Potamilus streckersoni TaxID=2493646 RepID=A0AAE0S1H0_9BIVA|nr:hypothetical protein CHS0354_025627 [Potamilus streckersoni]
MRSHFMCCFLLLTSFILSSENRTVKRDSYVLLFETVTEDTVDKEISLHLNGAGNPQKLIAKWTLEKYANTVTWRLHNYTKIFMDSKRNIRIANIDETYEGKYYIQYFPSLQTREVEIIITGNLADEIGEKIKSWLNDLQKFIEKYFGNLTDEIKEEMTERLTDHTFAGSEPLRGHIIAILLIAIFIYITVIVLLALFLMVHGAEVWKLLINAWYWCRKYRVGPQLPTQQTANSLMVKESGGTELVPPREPNASKDNSGETYPLLVENQASDSAPSKLSGGTDPHLSGGTDPHFPGEIDPHLRRRTDAHSPRVLVTQKNTFSETDFLPTAQGKKKIHIRETEL